MKRNVISGLLVALGSVACATGECPSVDAPEPGPEHEGLLDPMSAEFTEPPPDTFHVRLATTGGEVLIEVVTAWAPMGATRFYNLVRHGFYDGSAFFRVLPGYIAQFGASPIPAVQGAWDQAQLPDDSVRMSNTRMTVTFAAAGPNTRTTQLFVNYGDNSWLDTRGFAPFGRVIDGSGALLALHSGYGEVAPEGNGPNYGCMLEGGGAYLERSFPELDRIERAEIIAIPKR